MLDILSIVLGAAAMLILCWIWFVFVGMDRMGKSPEVKMQQEQIKCYGRLK